MENQVEHDIETRVIYRVYIQIVVAAPECPLSNLPMQISA